jgi:hypothetical protein|tara:strand:- start:98 stop:355 length:258 start_codon:yes stop_codon:yes gene_type:complete
MLKYGLTIASDVEGLKEEYLTLSEPIEELLGTRKSNEYRTIDEIVNSGDADFLDFAAYNYSGRYDMPYYGRAPIEEFSSISNQYF